MPTYAKVEVRASSANLHEAMTISEFLNRYKWWLALAVLLILNGIRYWPAKHAAPAGPPGVGRGFPTPDAAMQAKIDALPDDQKEAVNNWIRQQKDFFASVQNLPDDQMQQKMMEHFFQNPPPPGMPFRNPGGPPGAGPDGNPPPGGGNGGTGGPGGAGLGRPGGNGGPPGAGTPHIPPPAVRRGMDQGLVNAMKNGGF